MIAAMNPPSVIMVVGVTFCAILNGAGSVGRSRCKECIRSMRNRPSIHNSDAWEEYLYNDLINANNIIPSPF